MKVVKVFETGLVGGRTALKTDATYTPYVICSGYNADAPEGQKWASAYGYYETFEQMVEAIGKLTTDLFEARHSAGEVKVAPKNPINLAERAKMVRAMDMIVGYINCEDYIYRWLMGGVADGDIKEDTTDEDLEYYCEDDTFKDLMTLFLKLMAKAGNNGGLYCDKVVSGQKNTTWE